MSWPMHSDLLAGPPSMSPSVGQVWQSERSCGPGVPIGSSAHARE